MPLLPVNPGDYSPEMPMLDPSIVYKVVIDKLELNPELDINGNQYLKMAVSILEPETYKGSKIFCNYIGVPQPRHLVAEGDEFNAQKRAAAFERMCICFGLRGTADGFDTDTAIGAVGEVVIEEGMYKDRKTQGINALTGFLAPK